jgi:hypothetical protein
VSTDRFGAGPIGRGSVVDIGGLPILANVAVGPGRIDGVTLGLRCRLPRLHWHECVIRAWGASHPDNIVNVLDPLQGHRINASDR